MPDMYFDVDTAITAAPVNVFPLTDDTDFKTREESVVYNAAGMDLQWNFMTSAGAFTQTVVTPTTAGVYDWTNKGNGMYSIEIPASGGGTINNDTEGYGWFTGVATGVLPWRGPVIGFRAAALNDALCDGGDNLDVNTVQFNGTNATATGGRPEVNSTHWAGTAITATSIPVATAAGASGGLMISGTNSGTTTLGALTITGATTMSNGLAVSRSSANTSAVTFTGNGTGSGLVCTSGSGATGDGIQATAASTNGRGAVLTGTGTGGGLRTVGGATGSGITAVGGATSGSGIAATGGGTGSGAIFTSGSGATGNGVSMTAASTNGNGLALTKTGTGVALSGATTDLTLAKTTNITGFNDIAATAVVSSGAITTSGGAVSSVTTVTGNVNGSVGSVTGAVGSVTGSVGSVTGAVGSVTGAVGSVTGNVGGNVTGSVGSVATGGITTGSFAAGAIDAAAIAADAIGASELAADAVAEIADQVWDEVLSGHLTGGSTGAALNAAGSAGDPWTTALPGAYGAGTAGKIIGDNINATVSSRASQTSVDTVDANVDAILVDTADMQPKLGTPAGASVSADVAAVKADTAAILTDTGTTLDTNISAIKTQTDKFVFTVANQVDANIQYVNDVAVTGDGQPGTEWGP